MTICAAEYPASKSAPLFPVIPQTIPDGPVPLNESLGSWLYRFCCANGYPDIHNTFSKGGGGISLSGGKSTDAPYKTQGTIKSIAAVANVSLEQVGQLMLSQTLLSLRGNVNYASREWMLRSEKIERPGPWMRHVICPLCVLERAEPFWLQKWRLSTTTDCRLHKIMLLESCCDCETHFVIHSRRKQSLDRCECCDLHFSEMALEARKITNVAPAFAQRVGHNDPSTLPVAQSSEYHWWRGVRKILTYIADPQRAGLISHEGLPGEFRNLLLHISQSTKRCFDDWSIRHRHSALRFIEWLTTSWPHKFVNLLAGAESVYNPIASLIFSEPRWIEDAFEQVAIRASSIHTPYRQLQRPLLSNSVARLSIPISKRHQKVSTRARDNTVTHRWSTDYTVRVIKTLNARALAMPGLVETKSRFIRGATAIVLERGALSHLIGKHSSAAHEESLAQALQTMSAWTSCVHHLDASTNRNGHPSQQPAMHLNSGHLSKWLGCKSLHAQIPLFEWT